MFFNNSVLYGVIHKKMLEKFMYLEHVNKIILFRIYDISVCQSWPTLKTCFVDYSLFFELLSIYIYLFLCSSQKTSNKYTKYTHIWMWYFCSIQAVHKFIATSSRVNTFLPLLEPALFRWGEEKDIHKVAFRVFAISTCPLAVVNITTLILLFFYFIMWTI